MTVAHFNPPPGWPTPPRGWTPPPGWRPDAAWPAPPQGWELWVPDEDEFIAAAAGSAGSADPAGEEPQPAAASVPQHAVDVVKAKDRAALVARITALEEQLERSRAGADGGVLDLNDQRVLQDVGIYRYHHPLEDAPQYRNLLKELEDRIDNIIKTGKPVLAADLFTFDGSLAKGRKMVADLSKLMLRAYNAEADNCVRSLRAGNITTAKKRIEAAVAAIEKLGVIMDMRISPDYHSLRIEELELTADYQMKVQEERERAREERELLREQRRAEQELAAEKERLEKEKAHYLNAMESLRASGDDVAADELAQRLDQINSAIEQNDYRIANIRAGYVYVISNVGAFGPNIVKIGMTRRLEPRDRVRELGDASVPFPYDVHALFFSDDAISLEAELHRTFADRRVNFVNARREFFFARPAQVRDLLVEKVGGLLEFTEQPEAVEYLQSRGRWPSP
jgi:hypothetical protein